MPELPEVEVVRRGLAKHMLGRSIIDASVLHPRAARNQLGGSVELERNVLGLQVSAVKRRGKFLWLELVDDKTNPPDLALLVHLGMSGQMLMKTADATPHSHLRAKLQLDDGAQVWFVDQRTFGYWWLGELVDDVPSKVTHIALDLLDDSLDLRILATTIKAKNTEVKRVLLNQEIVSGIGNIYADEMLWEAKIHPQQQSNHLSIPKLLTLLEAGQQVMTRALDQGGTSFDSLYVNVNGNSGYFSRSLQAYGRAGEQCNRCGALIVRESFMNRGSHFCPRCQRR